MDGKIDKHVERLTEMNKLRNVASFWLCFANILAMHGPMNVKLTLSYFICFKFKPYQTCICICICILL